LLLSLLQLVHESSKLFRKGVIEGSLIPRLETTSDLGGKLGVSERTRNRPQTYRTIGSGGGHRLVVWWGLCSHDHFLAAPLTTLRMVHSRIYCQLMAAARVAAKLLTYGSFHSERGL
jgi:hypothetical protein